MSAPVSGNIVYSSVLSQDPFVTQIFTKNLETGDNVQLTNTGNNSWPRWSPDGSKILFVSWTKENLFDIYLMDKNGGNQRPVIASPADELTADWSPDGKKIVYVSNKDGSYEIYVSDLDRLTTVKLTDLNFTALPKWSSDGKRIAFISNTGVAGRSQVFVMNSDGSDIKQLTETNLDNFDGNPVWCPDDSCIVFSRYIGGVPKLMLIDLAKNEISPLIENIFNENLPETRLANSPIRGLIIFSAGGLFYAIDINNKKIYPLGVDALDSSLYP
jgi:Tol biopolymer transport system component